MNFIKSKLYLYRLCVSLAIINYNIIFRHIDAIIHKIIALRTYMLIFIVCNKL